jgi:hypothetical protein
MRAPTEENVAALRGAIAANNRSGGYFSDSIFKSYLAETLLMRAEMADAEVALQDGFAFVERSGERFWLADLYRVDGQIALRRPEMDRDTFASGHSSHIFPAPASARRLELRARSRALPPPSAVRLVHSRRPINPRAAPEADHCAITSSGGACST